MVVIVVESRWDRAFVDSAKTELEYKGSGIKSASGINSPGVKT